MPISQTSSEVRKPTGFRDLRVWQEGMKLAGEVYRLARALPPEERFALAQQLRRCAVSIVSNIAEGYARRRAAAEVREFRRFILIALGSLAELQTQLLLAEQERLLAGAIVAPAVDHAESVTRMLNALLRSLGPGKS